MTKREEDRIHATERRWTMLGEQEKRSALLSARFDPNDHYLTYWEMREYGRNDWKRLGRHILKQPMFEPIHSNDFVRIPKISPTRIFTVKYVRDSVSYEIALEERTDQIFFKQKEYVRVSRPDFVYNVDGLTIRTQHGQKVAKVSEEFEHLIQGMVDMMNAK